MCRTVEIARRQPWSTKVAQCRVDRAEHRCPRIQQRPIEIEYDTAPSACLPLHARGPAAGVDPRALPAVIFLKEIALLISAS